jgi:integrase
MAPPSPRRRSGRSRSGSPRREPSSAAGLRELEHAAGDVAAWRATLPTSSRYRLTSALRQALAAAVRWRYITRNPAVDAGRNPQPRPDELHPFTGEQIDALALELGPVFGPLVVFAAETGLRTNEWVALERRDVDRQGRAVVVQRRFADGVLTPYPKTKRSRRRVPLTARALRPSRPSLRASTRRSSSRPRRAGTSDSTRGGRANARDSEASIRARLDARADRSGAEVASGGEGDAAL